MEPRAPYVIVGLFVVVALGAALSFALWLGADRSDRNYEFYQVVFDQPVTGLAEGNRVLYSGIQVGDVLDLSLDPENPSRVRVRVRIARDVSIKTDTRAKLELTDITGNMSIQLHGGSFDAPQLHGDRDKPPVIPGDPSPLNQLMGDSQSIVNQVEQLLTNANRLLSQANAEKLTKTLNNLEQATNSLNQRGTQLQQSLTHLNALLVDARTLTGDMNRLIKRQGQPLFANANQTMQTLNALLSENQQSLNQGLSGLNELGPALNELQATLRSVQGVTEQLEDNPSEFLFGGEPIEEFSP